MTSGRASKLLIPAWRLVSNASATVAESNFGRRVPAKAASLLQRRNRTEGATKDLGRAFITLSTLILLIACALHPARAQQRLARTPVPVKIRARAGDTVQLLAERFNVLASDISRLNNLALDAALQPGEEVLIPSTTSPAFTPRRIVAGITNDARARATQHEPTIAAAAARYGVDPRLLWTIAFLETRFQPGQVSPKGARGMMQFMPDTAARYGLVNPNDPAAAIDAAARTCATSRAASITASISCWRATTPEKARSKRT